MQPSVLARSRPPAGAPFACRPVAAIGHSGPHPRPAGGRVQPLAPVGARGSAPQARACA